MRVPSFGSPVVGARAWLGAALVLVAVRTGLGTLESLIAAGPWLAAATVAAVLVLLSSALTRTVGAAEWAPVAALVTAVAVVSVGYGGESGAGLPGPGTPGRLADLIGEGARTVQEGRIPVTADRGLELMIVIGAVAVVVVVDTLALGLRSAGLAGAVLAALWAPTLVFERPPSTITLLLGATAWLLLVWLTRPVRGPDTGPWRELPTAAVVAAAASVAAVVLGPLAANLPGYGEVRLPATWGPGLTGGSTSLSNDLDMRADLGTQSPAEVLRYTTDVADVGPLRTATLLVYDGTRWDPGDQGALRPADGLLWSEDVEVSFTGRMAITVTSLQQAELPIPVGPRAINAPGTWVYDGLRDEVSGTTYPGLSYEVFVADRDLSPDALRADRPAPVEPDAPSLQVPETPYADRTAALAQEIAGYQPTAYDQALALQEYFRSPAFTYSTRLDRAQTADPLWDFLESRSGYCVQFATAMTIMARELGIPARVGVGFLPGSRGQDGQVTVAADRAHAWPELWFADAGWVRFEPTPGVQAGAPPAYADPAVTSFGDDPEQLPTQAPTTAPTTAPPADQGTTQGGIGTGTGARTLWPWLVTGLVLLLAGAGGFVALTRRRRPPFGPEEAWALLRTEAAGHGVTWADAATPRQVGAQLVAALAERDARHGAPSAVARLVSTLEAHRYAPHPAQVADQELLGWVQQVRAGLSADRRADVPSGPRTG